MEVRGMEWIYGDKDADEDSHGHGHGQSVEVMVDGAGGVEEGISLLNGERMRSGDRGGESAFTNSEAGEAAAAVAENGVFGEHQNRGSSLGQNGEQPNQRLTHEELQQRLRERLGDQQNSETEGVYL